MKWTTLPTFTESHEALGTSQSISNIHQPRVAYKHRQAGPGTTRPPLPRNPSESLLRNMAMAMQVSDMSSARRGVCAHRSPQSSEIPSAEENPNRYEALASPIRLGPSQSMPYATQFFVPASERRLPISHPSMAAMQRTAIHPSSHHVPHPSINTAPVSASVPLPYARTPRPNPNGPLAPTHVVTKPVPQPPSRPVPVLLSPLKVMFDNACRGIYSELSYLQSSCTAMMNRERKEKEMIRAHYFQMKRERDAARDRVKVLEERRSSSPEQKSPVLEVPHYSRKRAREGSESSESSTSSASLPRTPSPPVGTGHDVAVNDACELVYPPNIASPSPPPVSISKISLTPPSTPSFNVSPTLPSAPQRSATSTPSRDTQRSASYRSGASLKRSPSPNMMPSSPRDSGLPPAAKRRKVALLVRSTEEDAAMVFQQGFPHKENSEEDTVSSSGETDMDLESEEETVDILTGNSKMVESPRSLSNSTASSPSYPRLLPSLHEMYPGYTFSPVAPKQHTQKANARCV
ncbi:hypothetical protein VNI00_007790 [Paramarasmius palmivorus]|uniref:Uncharacterized protein n=1 Tax=Paramarasmius palmivorus TaxID=297713 RepID=A0AAW0CZB2_9AGAR